MARQMYKAGAHLTASTVNFTNPQIVTAPISAYVLPVLTGIFQQVEGVKVIHHGGPDFGDVVKNYVHINGVVGFVISPRDKIKAVRPLIGDKTILGNIDGPFICKHTPEAVYKKCVHILKENEGNSRYILSSSNADLTYETPLENIRAVSRAAEDYK
jgi:uroporphyrinogen-III decarboxylase